jgi:DNA-binding XRE family transcriptional regulator
VAQRVMLRQHRGDGFLEWVKNTMVLRTGNQIKAARALAELNQEQLAQRAGVNVNTIRNMEARGGETLVSGLDTVTKVQAALEAAGVEFIPENGGGAGVRLAKRG